MKTMTQTKAVLLLSTFMLVGAITAFGAGTLTPKGSPQKPIQIKNHHAEIVINNGFAQTEVTQVFFNPNDTDLEGIYTIPLPKTASLSEMTIWAGEVEMNGEVVEKKKADEIYEEEKNKGNDAGKAEKNSYQSFDFYVARIPAKGETRMRFVYYQPLKIDTGIGKYLYPLEPGGTDEQADSFWTQNKKVEGQFSVHLELKSAHPVVDVRIPTYSAIAQVDRKSEFVYSVDMKTTGTSLDRDFILYYRLADDLPGRFEVIPYRADADKPGTFMLVVTPGIDLQPLSQGADYIYVLDRSGSMNGGKLSTLVKGVSKAIGNMRPEDRFRIIAFNDGVQELTSSWVSATAENVQRELGKVSQLNSTGGTNIYAGLKCALDNLDDDRATSIVLVTDGVTNTGITSPKAFHKMVQKYDVRVFGFVMGNSANWPLMEMIGKVSGGFSAGVSNDDDIVGQIMLAKSKILHESLHDAKIEIKGVKTFETTDRLIGKVYRGEQLVLFGRYEKGGKAKVTLSAKLTGEDKDYSATFEFPDIDTDNPEIERLWALNQIEQYKALVYTGLEPEGELTNVEKELGVKYQLVTDETSMLVLSDESFALHKIDRKNKQRVAVERTAQAQRAKQAAPTNYTVSRKQKSFPIKAPRIGGGGGGAFGPFSALGVLLMLGVALVLKTDKK